MRNPWHALPGGDAVRAARWLRSAHHRFVESGELSRRLRPLVADSWHRSAAAGVPPEGALPEVVMTDHDLREYRRAHPLAVVMPVVRELLGAVIDDGQHLVTVTDDHGLLLWVEGSPGVRRRAERCNLVEGAVCSEAQVGTNAPGTALAVGQAVQVFAAEHFNPIIQQWTCSAAPIRHPHTGELLGSLDITGGDDLANPYSLALVQATARAVEAEIARLTAAREGLCDRPAAPPDGPGRLQVLGRDEALLQVDGREHRLSRRHSEILAVLAIAGGAGLTSEQLGLEVYGEDAPVVTLRAEMSRLRRLVGGGLLGSRPYRFTREIEADVLVVRDLLRRGRLTDAVSLFDGPLLPSSESPAVVRHRSLLDQQLRAFVLASRDLSVLSRWTAHRCGEDDLEAWEALATELPQHSPGRFAVDGRVRALSREYGLHST